MATAITYQQKPITKTSRKTVGKVTVVKLSILQYYYFIHTYLGGTIGRASTPGGMVCGCPFRGCACCRSCVGSGTCCVASSPFRLLPVRLGPNSVNASSSRVCMRLRVSSMSISDSLSVGLAELSPRPWEIKQTYRKLISVFS